MADEKGGHAGGHKVTSSGTRSDPPYIGWNITKLKNK